MITQHCEYCGVIADCDVNGLCDDCQEESEALIEAGADLDYHDFWGWDGGEQ